MISKALKTIDKYKMLQDTSNVVIGLSGGADSISLTHFLYNLSKEKNFYITAVHVNHCIRDEEAIRDEEFVKTFCNKLNINLIVKRVDVLKLSKNLKLSVEEAGRIVRYQILQEEAMKNLNSKIATAHTLSDNIETFIMRFVNGTALKGLCGIPPIRKNIIRPLINVKRSEIETYCKENGLEYVTDSSNLEKDYTRNKIRLDIIPQLKGMNPNLEDTFERMLYSLQADENYLEKKSEDILKDTDLSKIKHFDLALKNRILLKTLQQFTNSRIEQKHIKNLEEIINKGSGKICIPGKKILIYKNNNLSIEKHNSSSTSQWQYLIKPLNILTEIKTTIIIDIVNIDTYRKTFQNQNVMAFDFKKLPPNSVLRNRRPKDSFSFIKRNVTKSLKKLFNELKIPIQKRDQIPLLAYENEIVWIDGIGVSKNYVPNEKTELVGIIIKKDNSKNF